MSPTALSNKLFPKVFVSHPNLSYASCRDQYATLEYDKLEIKSSGIARTI